MSLRGQVPFTVLNYLITRATVDGTQESATVRVPYEDLLALIGKKVESDEDRQNSLLDLVIKMELSWDEHTEDDQEIVEIDTEFSEDYKD